MFALDIDELADVIEEFVTGATPTPGHESRARDRLVHRSCRINRACRADGRPRLDEICSTGTIR